MRARMLALVALGALGALGTLGAFGTGLAGRVALHRDGLAALKAALLQATRQSRNSCLRPAVRQATAFVAVWRQFDDERQVVRGGRIEDGAEVADRHIDPRYRGLAAPRRKNWEPP